MIHSAVVGNAVERGDVSFDSTSNWAAVNPVLLKNETATDTKTGDVRVGDGTTPYLTLKGQSATYIPRPGSGDATGSVPTKQSDGSIAYSIPTGADSTQRLLAELVAEQTDQSMLFLGDSTGNDVGEWIDLLSRQLAPLWPRWTVQYTLWDNTAGSYPTPTVLQTGTGSRTLTIYNASVAGFSTWEWQAARATAAIYALNPILIVVSLGHNEGTTPNFWYGQYAGFTEALTERLPGADLLCIGQNPEAANTFQQQRWTVIREICARKGYGYAPVGSAFIAYGATWATDLLVDGVHPNAAGSALWVANVLPLFQIQTARSPRPQQPSTFAQAGETLIANGDFAQFTLSSPDSWTLDTATATKDTTNFESANGYSVKLTATGAGGNFLQALPINRVQGRWVTFCARVFVPSGASLNVARMAIIDSTGSTIYPQGPGPTGEFRWITINRLIPSAATSCRVQIYADAGAGLGSFSLDRVVVTLGKFPRSAANAQKGATGATGLASPVQFAHMSTAGTHPAATAGASQFGGNVGVGGANQGFNVPMKAPTTFVANVLQWQCTVSSGNYDIGLSQSDGTRLWEKGSTPAPATGQIIETVSPGVSVTVGDTVMFRWSVDNTTIQARGVSGQAASQQRMVDGSAFALLQSSIFPLPASGSLGTTGVANWPLAMLRQVS